MKRQISLEKKIEDQFGIRKNMGEAMLALRLIIEENS